MARRNGVDLVIAKITGDDPSPKARYDATQELADLFNPPITVPAIYKFRRQGWFPIDRAKIISEKYDIPLSDLVRGDIREALLARNS
jgi:hypothetical protein